MTSRAVASIVAAGGLSVATAALAQETQLPPVEIRAPAPRPPAPRAPVQVTVRPEPTTPTTATPAVPADGGPAPVTASEFVFPRAPLLAQPFARPGEFLEATPGLIVTQHSGEGKANQYFLRGFNLDHGTDLAITVDGMPVNMRSHGHGQGYADINFLIPEVVAS